MKRFRPKWEADYEDGVCTADAPSGAILVAQCVDENLWLWCVDVYGEYDSSNPIGEAKTERGAKTGATRAYNRLVKEGVIKVEEEA